MAELIVYDEAPVLVTEEDFARFKEVLQKLSPEWKILTFEKPEQESEVLGIDYGRPGSEDRTVITRGYFDERGVLYVTDVEEL